MFGKRQNQQLDKLADRVFSYSIGMATIIYIILLLQVFLNYSYENSNSEYNEAIN